MIVRKKRFKAIDGESIFYHEFLPEKNTEIKYVIQVAHGMAEHSERYAEFAEFFTARGIAVYINDHRGHGYTAKSSAALGVWDFKHPWETVVDDIKQLNDIACKENSEKDIFIVGHSLGAFLTVSFLTKYSMSVKGAILTGIGFPSRIKLFPSYLYAKIQTFFSGNKYKSKTLDRISFSAYNRSFKEPFQWLTRNKVVVDKYLSDPMCRVVYTSSFYKSLLWGIMYSNKLANLRKIPQNFPLLFLSGANDPVGDYGNTVKFIVERHLKAGAKDLELKLYEGARHEILNEINNKQVFQNIFEWANKVRIKNIGKEF